MQPHPPQPAPNALVVANDRDALDRFYRPLVVLVALLAGIITLLMLGMLLLVLIAPSIGDGSSSWSTLILFAVALAVTGSTFMQLGVLVSTWRSMRALGDRVVADDRGLVARLPRVDVRMPWSAVRSATVAGTGTRERMTVLVDAAQLEGTLPERQRRAVAKRGLRLAGVGMRPGLDAVAHAIAVGTRGRVQVQRA